MSNTRSARRTPVTTSLLILCTVIFLCVNFLPLKISEGSRIILFGAYYKTFMIAGEWWRLLTVGLVHYSLWHLAMNMMSLINLGRFLELQLGSRRFLSVLAMSTIGGSLFLFASKGNTIAVGLSGGLYGLLGFMLLVMFKNGSLKHPVFRAYMIRMIVVNLTINLLPGIAYMAHLGGFLTGVLCALVLSEDPDIRKIRIHTLIASLILAGFLGYRVSQKMYIRTDERYLGTDIEVLRTYRDLGLRNYSMYIAEKIDAQYDTIYLETALEEE